MSLPPLPVSRLRWRVSPLDLPFENTDDLEPDVALAGQGEALRDLGVALDLAGGGRNVCVSLPTELADLGEFASLVRTVPRRTGEDLVFVHNLDEPWRPVLLRLPAGEGRAFRAALSALLVRLLQDVPACLRSVSVEGRRLAIRRRLDDRRRASWARVEAAIGPDLVLQPAGEGGLRMEVRLRRDAEEPWSRWDLESALRAGGEEGDLERLLVAMVRAEERLVREEALFHPVAARAELRLVQVERRAAGEAVHRAFRELVARFPSAETWLRRLQAFAADRYWFFLEGEGDAPIPPPPSPGWSRIALMETPWRPGMEEEPNQLMAAFQANVVHHADVAREVCVLEQPTWSGLLGGSFVDSSQNRRPDWRDLRPGALLDASGGVLVLSLAGLLAAPGVWRGLKRALGERRLTIVNADVDAVGNTPAFQPDPVPVETTIIAVADPALVTWMYEADPEFVDLFPWHVQFEPGVAEDPSPALALGHFLAGRIRGTRLPHASADGFAALLEWAREEAPVPGQVCASPTRWMEIYREAASRVGVPGRVGRSEVAAALGARRSRQDQAERRIEEGVRAGALRVDTEGEVVGQVNGLAVHRVGMHTFGRALRITATAGTGRPGLVNIEREAGLSGRVHDKGVQILGGVLRDRFGRGANLAVSASICVEQSYGRLDGDSASLAECLALLSALGGIPLRQDVAVTGSLDQLGRVQAIGGVNTKVRAFFKLCAERGLTGGHGVVIPAANTRDLQVSEDVAEACARGKFHVWAVSTLEEAVELLTGRPAGGIGSDRQYLDGTVFRAVADGFRQLQDLVRLPGRKGLEG